MRKGVDLTLNVTGVNFGVTHLFMAEINTSTSVDYTIIQSLIANSTRQDALATNNTFNESSVVVQTEAIVSRKFADQQSWFTETFMKTVDEFNTVTQERDTLRIKSDLCEKNLEGSVFIVDKLNATTGQTLDLCQRENKTLAYILIASITVAIGVMLIFAYSRFRSGGLSFG